jgi:hypothetical protein
MCDSHQSVVQGVGDVDRFQQSTTEVAGLPDSDYGGRWSKCSEIHQPGPALGYISLTGLVDVPGGVDRTKSSGAHPDAAGGGCLVESDQAFVVAGSADVELSTPHVCD